MTAREKALVAAAREITSWDWTHLLIDHPDAEVVREDVRRLEAALAMPEEDGPDPASRERVTAALFQIRAAERLLVDEIERTR